MSYCSPGSFGVLQNFFGCQKSAGRRPEEDAPRQDYSAEQKGWRVRARLRGLFSVQSWSRLAVTGAVDIPDGL